MEFPILYSRTSTGAIQTWLITVDGDSYYTISGQIDGIKTRSKPTITKGKNAGKTNATTPEEQALKDAQAKFDKQLREDYHESISDIDTPRFVQPMLAKKYNDYASKLNLGMWIIQCKFNGGRCIATSTGLWTRKGKRILAVPHIERSLQPFFKENPKAVLDGELFNHGLRQHLNEIMKLIRRTVHLNQDHYDRSEKFIKYYVYDGYDFNGLDKEAPYLERKKFIDSIIEDYEYLAHTEDLEAVDEDNMWSIYDNLIKDGQEGIILRLKNSHYENKRSKNLLKLKPTDDAEFLITDIVDAGGNWSGLAKVITCKMDNGKLFNATFKGTMEQAKGVLDNKSDYIGRKFTIFYNGLTGLGTPNYAQFSLDNSVDEDDK